MDLILKRMYLPEGTNGQIWLQQQLICMTIELPWKNNLKCKSCIPEGKYPLKKRFSERFGWHVWIDLVPNRSLILFHPANDALKELNGCIAPVTSLLGEGKGIDSRKAFERLKKIVYAYLQRGEQVFLHIQKQTL
ncbi:Uncharacterised protein [Algoriella xinjiangensis]|uniref:DUF5675 family protein n=1 Tax=Algoriella xinjiangensis TaxID=684065 RepID=UPI000F63AED3|nr:DUF5675 family protein [Algoriella xinjiangensis]VDH17455.1 Uncharacterised protein [Algoriella xinjiangensis]